MPFGLVGVPFTFRRLMTLILRNLENVDAYDDDVVVYNHEATDHLKHVEAVLKRIEEFGLRVIKDTSQIARSSIMLLRCKVGSEAIKPLSEKILTISSIVVLISKRILRRFLRKGAFYRRFVKNYNDVAALLCKLLSNTKFT